MNKTIIVSNRLPVNITLCNEQVKAEPSVGGLATGMRSVHAEGNGIWIGWTGIAKEDVTAVQQQEINEALKKEKCVGVALTNDEVEKFYNGFSNRALWPLFHYFQEYAEFELEQWNAYRDVNQKFADAVLEYAHEGDTIWVHDYQLLLVPQMLREKKPGLTIGFFLHIPYPSYEIFRVFPWREELLEGMLGANLVGFHTYDYVRHFLSSVSRITGLETRFNDIYYKGRVIKVDSFPMGIDYARFHEAALEHSTCPESKRSELMQKLQEHSNAYTGSKLILSIDRMDYTKGIPARIRAFEYFLNKYPEYREKVRLVMLAVPSRSNVPQYQMLKKETDELVGRVNGQFATINWTPIWYFYRSMPFEDLVDLYASSHVALISPLRDGMNLVAKEYVATRVKQDGVLLLSEMAGAAKEMHEAVLINPHNFEHLADSLKYALEMPEEEQKRRMAALQRRIKRYSVDRWAEEFLKALEAGRNLIDAPVAREINSGIKSELLDTYRKAIKRLLLLDYDGTLVGFRNKPSDASPDESLYQLLDRIAADPNTEIAIISGRDRETLEEWFGHREFTLITDHGVWLRKNGAWETLEHLRNDWKDNIRPVLETFTDRTPGTFIEEKDYSLAWHYRQADPELANLRKTELKPMLTTLIANNALSVLEGNKVLEVKSSSINKGRAATRVAATDDYDFIFAIGDDWTDEYMFEELPENSFTVKVGLQQTLANYFVRDLEEVRVLLELFAKEYIPQAEKMY